MNDSVTESNNTIESFLDENLKNTLPSLLGAKERHQIIEAFLKDELELPGYQAKLVTQIIVPSLEKLLGGTVSRSFNNMNDALRGRFEGYDRMVLGIGRWLSYRFEPSKAKGVFLKKLTPVSDDIPEVVWNKFNSQTRVWITELARLEQISLALGDLNANITLDIDKPKNLAGLQPSWWLRPYNDFIPMEGRSPYLEYLTAFCSDKFFFRWTLLIGDGGIGKTRLAHEFAKMQKAAEWHAGFLRHASLEQLVDHPGFKNWRPFMNTLMVVDYAADKIDALKKMLVNCVRLAAEAETEDNPVRLRILLLERHGIQEDGWLKQVMTAGEGAHHDDIVSSMLPPRKIKAPAEKSDNATMQDILRRTLKSWQAVTGKQTPVLLEFDEEGLEHFRVVTQMRPLFVQMAGIHACETGDASGLTRWTRDDLLKSAVKREREYIQKKSSILIPSVCIERAVALLAFTGPQRLKADKWMKLLGDDAYACGYPGVQPGAVCDAVRDLLGVGAGGITPVGPDILAEAFSVSVLKETETNVVVLLKRI